MQTFVRQPVLYPVSVVFVDDNPDFLQALRGAFPDEHLNLFFTQPRVALDFVSSRDVEMPPTAADYFGAEKKAAMRSARTRSPTPPDSRRWARWSWTFRCRRSTASSFFPPSATQTA